MSYKQQPTNTGVAKDHEEHFPEPLIRNVKLVGENFEEGNVEEGSTSNTLEQPVTYVLRKAGGKVGHGNTNTNTYRAWDTEHDIGEDETLDREIRLGNIEPEAERHNSLVDDDSNKDGD